MGGGGKDGDEEGGEGEGRGEVTMGGEKREGNNKKSYHQTAVNGEVDCIVISFETTNSSKTDRKRSLRQLD